jgi:amino acid transporter
MASEEERSYPDRLARRLTTSDAVVIGMGSMIGAGIFVALGPTAEAAGTALLVGLAIAAAVAFCNATSSAQLAAVYPESGGTYVYGRERLGPLWGFLAGWGFVIGKTASLSAIALTFGEYAWPDFARPLAVASVVVRGAIGFSSFAVLVYYGIANVSAWTQPSGQRRWPRALQAFGVAGCAVLALTLPFSSILGGLTVLVAGAVVWLVRHNVTSAR